MGPEEGTGKRSALPDDMESGDEASPPLIASSILEPTALSSLAPCASENLFDDGVRMIARRASKRFLHEILKLARLISPRPRYLIFRLIFSGLR